MRRFQQFFTRYKKECIALLVFVLCLGIFSINYAFAAVEPVRSIVIQSEHTDFASGEEGSWQVTKSGYWTNYGEAEVTLDVDTSLMTNNQYTDIIFVLDISGSMSGDKLDRVKSDSKELVSSLLSNKNNRAALITFDTSSQIVSELTNDEEQLIHEIDNLQDTGSTNYYQALVNVDSILQDQYQYLKSAYPYITINGIQYEMGNAILSPIKEISDNQFIADMETLNNVLFDASVAPVTYDTYQIVDYIDNENFTLGSASDIKVSQGSVELTNEDGKQKITWTLDNLASGREANLTMKLKLKDELVGQGGIYPTNESTEVISKIENQEEDVTTSNTPILADNYKVIYDGNAPVGGTVTNVPEAYNYSVFSTIEISDQVPSCSGYEFKGWTITTNGVTRVSEDYFIMPGEDVVIKAEWSKVGITKSMNGTVNNMGDPIMKRYTLSTNTDYHSSTYKSKITSIVTKDNMEIPSTAIETWDVSEAGDSSVIAYVEDDGRGAGTYKVTIGAQGNIIANKSSSYLFYGFANVESIDLTYLDTSQVTKMSSMFTGCSKLTSLDLSSFDTSQVTDMGGATTYRPSSMSSSGDKYGMFEDCSNLQTIIFGSKFVTDNVTNMDSMFGDCSSLTSLDLSNFNTSQVTDMSAMFNQCSSIKNLNVTHFDTSRVIDMAAMFSGCSSLTSLDLSNFDTSKVTNMIGLFSSCNNLATLNIETFKTAEVIYMTSMFKNCSSLQDLDLNSFNTGKVTDMREMFQYCESLTNLDVSSFNTSQVTDIKSMFHYCESLTNITLGKNWDTSKVTDMSSMFGSCHNITSLDLSNFDTSRVTDISYMFQYCFSLTSLDLSNFDTSKVTDMSNMFQECGNLASLDLSSFDTSQVTDMRYMFYGCNELLSLDMRNATFNATSYSNMFYYVSNSITVIVKDETAKTWIENKLSGKGTVTIASA